MCPPPDDSQQWVACFLEYEDATVTVHDILYERIGSEWRQHVGAYRKLRLSPERVVAGLEQRGFQVRVEPGLAGMVRLIAKRPDRANTAIRL